MSENGKQLRVSTSFLQTETLLQIYYLPNILKTAISNVVPYIT